MFSFWILVSWWSRGPIFDFTRLDPNRFEVLTIGRIQSPTSVLWHRGRLFLGADLMEPQPGIHVVNRYPPGRYRADIFFHLPQQEVQGIRLIENGNFEVFSSRFFSPSRRDWNNQIIVVNADRRRVEERIDIPVDNLCSDGLPDCGMVAAFPLDKDRLVVFTRQRPARCILLSRDKEGMVEQRAMSITLGRKLPLISEVVLTGKRLLFLLKDQHMIAETSLADLETVLEQVKRTANRLELKPVLDFRTLSRRFATENPTYDFGGLAEGFTADYLGRLYLIFNNRGYQWRRTPDGGTDRNPRLLVLTPPLPRVLTSGEQAGLSVRRGNLE
ncbi:MAG: hypothetical protein QNK37_06485 [Acidobacteriota bacterium]|nr:hypothetical protein [Acidobacteriota bacterium]